MANKTANRIFLPKIIPPISPKETGILFRVSTNNKNVYNEIMAILDNNAVEKSKPPL